MDEVAQLKLRLLHTASASLIAEPKFYRVDDPTRAYIASRADALLPVDPEFLLKLALYTRCTLNIRSTANFLLAYCAEHVETRYYLRKYFSAAILLPSDWLEVAMLTRSLTGFEGAEARNLPMQLRKCMVERFKGFNEYQLGKYNKDSGKNQRAAEKRKEKAKGKMKAKVQRKVGSESEEEKPERLPGQREKSDKPSLTIKQLVRSLHIAEPREYVLKILGKRYPLTEAEFATLGLPGRFKPELAGKRMRLAVPETWETQLSASGNSAQTWETLIDHNALPFMAMLRNLRNLICTGVQPNYHRIVQNRLCNERQVMNSRQFPFRFFSAYEAVEAGWARVQAMQKEASSPQPARGRGRGGRGRGGRGAASAPRREGKQTKCVHAPKRSIIDAYLKALDTAVQIATVNNVKPVAGRSMVLVNVGRDMGREAGGAAAQLGSKVSNVRQLGILMGLMCAYMCEDCKLYIYACPDRQGSRGRSPISVALAEGTILANMSRVLESASVIERGTGLPMDLLEDVLRTETRIENLLVFSDKTLGMPPHGEGDDDSRRMVEFVRKYRELVNPDLMYLSCALCGPRAQVLLPVDREKGRTQAHSSDPLRDVFVNGFSDAVLRFVGECSDENQLAAVETIDQQHNLSDRPHMSRVVDAPEGETDEPEPEWTPLLKLPTTAAGVEEEDGKAEEKVKWRTIMVFISSTFTDMHGERDVLSREVFPALREMCRTKFIHVREIDLRWGVTQKDAENNKGVEICLKEVERCTPFFVGLLGRRYGFVPTEYRVPYGTSFRHLRGYPSGRSVTELEIAHILGGNSKGRRACFYFRDDSFYDNVPRQQRQVLEDFAAERKEKLATLKQQIRDAVPESRVFDGYPAVYGGLLKVAGGPVTGYPVAKDLDEFSRRVLRDLWQAVCEEFPTDPVPLSPLTLSRLPHDSLMDFHTAHFVGRRAELERLRSFVGASGPSFRAAEKPQWAVVCGPVGVGKSALLSQFVRETAHEKSRDERLVLYHFVGAGPGSDDVRACVRLLCLELQAKCRLADEPVPEDPLELVQALGRLLEKAGRRRRVLLVVDSVDQLRVQTAREGVGAGGVQLQWLPAALPENVQVVLSAANGEQLVELLSGGAAGGSSSLSGSGGGAGSVEVVKLSVLDQSERRLLVRSILAPYNKELDESYTNNQMRALVSKAEAGLPMFLYVACEELRVFGVFEQLSERIRAMSNTLAALFEEVLNRLEHDFGAALVRRAVGLLALSRDGLAESDLLALCRLEAELQRMLGSEGGALTTLLSNMTAFLLHDGRVVRIAHSRFRAAVLARFFPSPSALRNAHAELARWWLREADPSGDGSFRGGARAVGQIVYQALAAGDPQLLDATLCNLVFVSRRCAKGQAFDLLGEYDSATALLASSTGAGGGGGGTSRLLASPFSSRRSTATSGSRSSSSDGAQRAMWEAVSDRLLDFAEFFSQNVQELTRRPALALQLAGNYPDDSEVYRAAVEVAAARAPVWLRWANKPQVPGQCQLRLSPDNRAVLALAVVPDGRRVVVATRDSRLHVYDVRSGEEVGRPLEGHANWVAALSVSPDGSSLASAGHDCTVRLWDLRRGQSVRVLCRHHRRASGVAWSPDGQWVLSCGWDCRLRLCDVFGDGYAPTDSVLDERSDVRGRKDSTMVERDGDGAWVLKGHTKPVSAVSFAPGGQRAASASWDGTVRVWDLLNRKLVRVLAGAHVGSITALAFSPAAVVGGSRAGGGDGEAGAKAGYGSQQLVSCGLEGRIVIWDAEAGTAVATLTDHRPSTRVASLAFDSAGKFFSSAGADRRVLVYRASPGRLDAQLSPPQDAGAVLSVAFGVHAVLGERVAAGFHSGLVVVYSPNRAGGSPRVIEAHSMAVRGLDMDGSTRKLLTASADCSVKMWAVCAASSPVLTMTHHSAPVNVVAFAPNGSMFCTGSEDCSAALVAAGRARRGEVLARLEGHTSYVMAVSWRSDGTALATASRDNSVRLWAISPSAVLGGVKAECCQILTGHLDWATCVAWAPDGRTLATGSWDFTARLWSVNSTLTKQECTHTLVGHGGSVSALAFTSSGRQLVTAGSDALALVWDARAGARLGALGPEAFGGARVTSVAFHPTAGMSGASGPSEREVSLAAGAEDGRVRVFAPFAVAQLAHLVGHSDVAQAVAFLPPPADKRTRSDVDGDAPPELVSGGLDRSLRVWDAEPTRGAAHERLQQAAGAGAGASSLLSSTGGGSLFGLSSSSSLLSAFDSAGPRSKKKEIAVPRLGHATAVRGVGAAGLQTAVSAGADRTLRVFSRGSAGWCESGCFEMFSPSREPLDNRARRGLRCFAVCPTSDDVGDEENAPVMCIAGGDDFKEHLALVALPGSRAAAAASASATSTSDADLGEFDEGDEGEDGLEGARRATLLHAGSVGGSGAGTTSVSAVAITRMRAGGWLCAGGTWHGKVEVFRLSPGTSSPWELCTSKWNKQPNDSWRSALVFGGETTLVDAGRDQAVRLWDVERGAVANSMRGHDHWVLALAWAGAGTSSRRLVSGDRAGVVRLWDPSSAACVKTLQCSGGCATDGTAAVNAVAFAHGGTYVLSGGADGRVRLWDLRRGRELTSFITEAPVTSLAVGPGDVVVAAGDAMGRISFLNLVLPSAE